MTMRRRGAVALLLGAALIGGGALGASAQGPDGIVSVSHRSLFASARSGISDIASRLGIDDEGSGQPGAIDDGQDLLPQAKITLDQAIRAAQAAAPDGRLGEVDVEHYRGHLVFNVDVGQQDVKVDADTGAVLGAGED